MGETQSTEAGVDVADNPEGSALTESSPPNVDDEEYVCSVCPMCVSRGLKEASFYTCPVGMGRSLADSRWSLVKRCVRKLYVRSNFQPKIL